MAGITCELVKSTFFLVHCLICYCGFYELMYCSCSKCYAYVGIFEQVGDFSYLWAVVGECSPEFLFFLFSFCTVCFMLHLSVYFVV